MNNIVPIAPSRGKVPESEKVTINLGFVDLGHIDLLVSEGFYANRTDFIRTAIRNQLATQSDALKQVVSRKLLVLGLATIAHDVPVELALATIDSLTVLGAFHASPAVKQALADRFVF